MPSRRRRALILALCLAPGLWQLCEGGYIHAKARLAQVLMMHAWGRAAAGDVAAKPWPWADTWPVARLSGPRGQSVIVLAGASGRTLAFGPGHVTGTALPAHAGHSIVSGHRDTHFRFLQNLQAGDELVAETPHGRRQRYTITDIRIVDGRNARLLNDPVTSRLTLVTCYPFDAARAGGHLRYVVSAEAQATESPEGKATRTTGNAV